MVDHADLIAGENLYKELLRSKGRDDVGAGSARDLASLVGRVARIAVTCPHK